MGLNFGVGVRGSPFVNGPILSLVSKTSSAQITNKIQTFRVWSVRYVELVQQEARCWNKFRKFFHDCLEFDLFLSWYVLSILYYFTYYFIFVQATPVGSGLFRFLDQCPPKFMNFKINLLDLQFFAETGSKSQIFRRNFHGILIMM